MVPNGGIPKLVPKVPVLGLGMARYHIAISTENITFSEKFLLDRTAPVVHTIARMKQRGYMFSTIDLSALDKC
jgi:hypothetical protein